MQAPPTDAEPLYTGRPRLSYAMNIVAVVFGLVVVAALASAAYIPESSDIRGYAFFAAGGSWVLAGIAWIVAERNRRRLTPAGEVQEIAARINQLSDQLGELTGSPAPMLSSRRPGEKPSPRPRRNLERVPV